MKLVLVALLLSFVLVGCTFQQTATPTPTPTVTATATATATATSTAIPTPTAEPTATTSPAEKLSQLQASTELVLEEVYGVDFVFTEDRSPINGEITYQTGNSDNYFDLQATVKKGISKEWPPTSNLVKMKGESGLEKTVSYRQDNSEQISIVTEFAMECNNFGQVVEVTVREKNTPVLPFKDLAGKMIAKLIDSCPA